MTTDGVTIEQACFHVLNEDNDKGGDGSFTGFGNIKIGNLPPSENEYFYNLLKQDPNPPWKSLARVMNIPTSSVKRFERSENPSRRFIIYISDAKSMSLSRLIPYLLKIGLRQLVELIERTTTDKECVLSDIKDKIIWIIEDALNVVPYPLWNKMAIEKKLSEVSIYDIANGRIPETEEIDEMYVTEFRTYLKDFCGFRETIYEQTNVVEKDTVCELNTIRSLEKENSTPDRKKNPSAELKKVQKMTGKEVLDFVKDSCFEEQ
ncbi:hypothetical protein KUTeg_008407 [Tegillarca granosa]|uniref:Death domain-containing protein n=1 Tax=Tegillarca granosa TaxID=220873 RepID=A0ABQ9FB91_TEGGR|nr:hypothetical protein KUTeg_008407 [Tegillarca granosa]